MARKRYVITFYKIVNGVVKVEPCAGPIFTKKREAVSSFAYVIRRFTEQHPRSITAIVDMPTPHNVIEARHLGKSRIMTIETI